MSARAILARRSPRLRRAEEAELAAPEEEEAGERAAPAPDPLMTAEIHDEGSDGEVQELQPPEDPQEKGEEELRSIRAFKRKLDEYDADDKHYEQEEETGTFGVPGAVDGV